MANQQHLHILKQGVEVWNAWRRETVSVNPDLSDAQLHDLQFVNADLRRTDLSGARLDGAILAYANLHDANLEETNLSGAELLLANFTGAYLAYANLSSANLSGANFNNADLTGADLRSATMIRTIFLGTSLRKAAFDKVCLEGAAFSEVDLNEVLGIENVDHKGPSDISISTIYISQGKIPEVFLRGCGVSNDLLTHIPALVTSIQPIQFYSCFISYSGKDEGFARRLHSRMREAELRVWFAPEDMKGGDKLYDQIDRAIQVHDRLLLVLSEESLRSKWVELEIRQARKVELLEGRRKLFPIRLVGYEALKEWVRIDSTTGEDLAEEVRSYFIPDFSNWKNHDDFERAFKRLLADLKESA